jgi:hypothetical protein
MMDHDNAARFTHVELEKMLLAISDRLLVVEAKLGLPLSYVEETIADGLVREREERRLAEIRRLEAFRVASAEAEQLGHRGPLDEYTLRLRAGEFEPPPRPNGGG